MINIVCWMIAVQVAQFVLFVALAVDKAPRHTVKRRWGDNFRVLHMPGACVYAAQEDHGCDEFRYWKDICAPFCSFDEAARACDQAWTTHLLERGFKQLECVVA